jgi:hypothetical protein
MYIPQEAQQRLEFIAKELGRTVEDLAATAVEEAALNFFRYRKDDPVKTCGWKI